MIFLFLKSQGTTPKGNKALWKDGVLDGAPLAWSCFQSRRLDREGEEAVWLGRLLAFRIKTRLLHEMI